MLHRRAHLGAKPRDVLSGRGHKLGRLPRNSSVSGHDHARVEAVDRRQRLEQLTGISVYHHRHSVFDQQISGKKYPILRKPHHKISGAVGGAGMADDESAFSQLERIHSGDWTVGRIGELESSHGVEAHHPHPICDQRVLARFGCENSPIGMRDDFGAEPAEDNAPKMMVRMVVGQDQPGDGCRRDSPDRVHQLLPLLRTRQCVDDHNAFTGDQEAGVGSSLRTPAGIADGCVHAGSKAANGRVRRRGGDSRYNQESGEQENWSEWKGQAEMKLMLTDCLKEAPLLSDQTMVSGASLSAFRVKLTTGSRLIPEVHSNRATSWLP